VCKGVARLNFKRRQPPLFPSSLPSSSLPSIPLPFLFFPLLPLLTRGLGSAWAPPVGSERFGAYLNQKRMALVTTLLWILNQNIFSFLDWVSACQLSSLQKKHGEAIASPPATPPDVCNECYDIGGVPRQSEEQQALPDWTGTLGSCRTSSSPVFHSARHVSIHLSRHGNPKWVSEQFLNGTSACKRPFRSYKRLKVR